MTKTQHANRFAVLLAAGASRRFNHQPKLAALVGGKPLLQRACEALASSSVDRSVVVLGPDTQHLHHHCSAAGLDWVLNPDARAGQSTSVRCGLSQAPQCSVGCIFIAADQPLLESHHIDQVLTAGLDGDQVAYAVAADDTSRSERARRGTPVYFPKRYFPQLHDSTGDEGGRQLLRQLEPRQVAEVELPVEVLIDVDTPDDLRRLDMTINDRAR